MHWGAEKTPFGVFLFSLAFQSFKYIVAVWLFMYSAHAFGMEKRLPNWPVVQAKVSANKQSRTYPVGNNIHVHL
jgi:hypothetical protein